jgi:hypothetical protein
VKAAYILLHLKLSTTHLLICTKMTVMVFCFYTGAHHIDLRPATPEDPDWLVSLRESELKIISGWLSEYYGARGGALIQPVAVKGSSAS